MNDSIFMSARTSWQESDRIKRQSRHIYNKLHSINADSDFVRRTALKFPQLLLIANLRCGAWYTDPGLTSAVSYFKSTDGHTHQWAFSLKRANLHLLPGILESGGCIIVDSTRRGKSMPDALSKTIPIWCAVLNRASRKLHGVPRDNGMGDLVTPPWMVPATEHDQIDCLIDSFVDSLLTSDLETPKLCLPLRPSFLTPQRDQHLKDKLDTLDQTCIPIVLLSASRLIQQSAELIQSQSNYVYVQGAGDDHENWARDLTPDLFWAHRDELLACTDDNIESFVDELVQSSIAHANRHWFTPKHGFINQMMAVSLTAETDSMTKDVEIGQTGILIGYRSADHGFAVNELDRYQLIIHISGLDSSGSTDAPAEDSRTSSKVSHIHMKPNKKGLTSMRSLFPAAIERAFDALTGPTDTCPRPAVLICCEDGKDLSGALTVAILASCFDDTRSLIQDDEKRRAHCRNLTKDSTRRRLQWLVSANPKASPSRAFLLRVNELLLSGQHRQDCPQGGRKFRA